MDKGPLTGIETWTGVEARLLRTVALRMSVREFAAFLGLPPRTISKWEQAGGCRQPRPAMQAILDAALLRADDDARTRFKLALEQRWPVRSNGTRSLSVSAEWDEEAWADDIERARLHADRQDFEFASRLMSRWIQAAADRSLDDRGLYLKAQSLIVLGNVRRDQGALFGPQSADFSYRQALTIFRSLGNQRRMAQTELLLIVLREMSGQLEPAAARYLELANDERLGAVDRARARLWVATALTKGSTLTDDQAAISITSIHRAIQEFEVLDEPDEWSVSHQKLALANLAAGDLGKASEAIELAIESRRIDSPLQRVRLDTAYAHILCSDRQTRDSGLTLLDQTYSTAATFKLAHQMTSIERIRDRLDRHIRRRDRSVIDPTPDQLDDARIIWDYHQMGHSPRRCDAAIGLGSHDLGVAEYAAGLYHRGLFPVLVFSGATSPTTVTRFPRGEAVHYREHAMTFGVPEESILVEPHAVNTGRNIELSRQLLSQADIQPRTVLLISKPYMERRAYATCRKLWPDVEPVCTSEPLKFEDYVASIGDRRLVLDMLVGDLQRVIEYPKQGFAIAQGVPSDVLGAYRRLVRGGYTSRLMT